MKKHRSTNFNKHNKDTRFDTDLERVFESFKNKPQTMKECDRAVGVMRESICRYVSILKKAGHIQIIAKRRCTITGFKQVGVYSGNPKLFPKPIKTLFDHEAY